MFGLTTEAHEAEEGDCGDAAVLAGAATTTPSPIQTDGAGGDNDHTVVIILLVMIICACGLGMCTLLAQRFGIECCGSQRDFRGLSIEKGGSYANPAYEAVEDPSGNGSSSI